MRLSWDESYPAVASGLASGFPTVRDESRVATRRFGNNGGWLVNFRLTGPEDLFLGLACCILGNRSLPLH